MVPTALGLYRIHEIEKVHDLEEKVSDELRQVLAGLSPASDRP